MRDLNLTLCCVVTSLIASAVTISPSDKVVFSFPEFPYKETSKNVSQGKALGRCAVVGSRSLSRFLIHCNVLSCPGNGFPRVRIGVRAKSFLQPARVHQPRALRAGVRVAVLLLGDLPV